MNTVIVKMNTLAPNGIEYTLTYIHGDATLWECTNGKKHVVKSWDNVSLECVYGHMYAIAEGNYKAIR